MKKFMILVLLIGISLAVEPLKTTISPCVQKANPKSPEDCFELDTQEFGQTCCYFEGTYTDEGESPVNGAACLEAFRIDVSNGTIKHETQKKIEEGTYWKNYPPIKNISRFLCYDSISECEKKQPAPNENECFNAKAELTNEGCCYLESDWEEGERKQEEIMGYCIDIKLADSETQKKIEDTKAKILNGTYWDGDYGKPTKIKKLVCANTKSSAYLMKVNSILFGLLLILF